jgi:hypothetical protein
VATQPDGGARSAGETAGAASNTVSFGVPPGWRKTKESLEEGGSPVVYYTISGDQGAVQVVLRKAGAPTPTPAEEAALARAGLEADLGGSVLVGDPRPITRTLSGRPVQGLAMPVTVSIDGMTLEGLHRVWVVEGKSMTAQVIVDLSDTSDPAGESSVDEVLNNLVVP